MRLLRLRDFFNSSLGRKRDATLWLNINVWGAVHNMLVNVEPRRTCPTDYKVGKKHYLGPTEYRSPWEYRLQKMVGCGRLHPSRVGTEGMRQQR